MLDENSKDLLTIIGIILAVIAIGLTIYGFDKKRRSNLLKLFDKAFFYVSVIVNLYYISTFFNEEMTHKSIFLLVCSVVAVVSLTILSLIRRITDLQAKQIDISCDMLKISEEKVAILKLNSNILLKVCEFIDNINQNEFKKKYANEITEISDMYKSRELKKTNRN